MDSIIITELKPDFYAFGNKGACWSNQVHISQTGVGKHTTLCGIPMLSQNAWANGHKTLPDNQEITTIRCQECVKIYGGLQTGQLIRKES